MNGPHGAPQPGSRGGMSTLTMAILGVLAYKAVQHFGAPAGATPSSPVAPGGASSSPLGPLGNLIGGGGLSGSVLSNGLGNIIRDLENSGQGPAAQSWIGNEPNQPITPNSLEAALAAKRSTPSPGTPAWIAAPCSMG